MSKKRLFAVIGGVVSLAAVAVLLWWVLGSKADQTSASQQATPSMSVQAPAPSTAQQLPFTAEDAVRLEQALNSNEKAVQAQALVPELREGEWLSSGVLPDGVTLKIDRNSFVPEKAIVQADVSDSAHTRFVLYLTYAEGKWLIATTEKA